MKLCMYCSIISLFPEFFDGPLQNGLMQRAREAGLVSFAFHNPRDYATDKHRHIDDRPYGGSPGMVMQPAPVAAALRAATTHEQAQGLAQAKGQGKHRALLLSPSGRPFDQAMARELAAHCENGHLTLVCGRYEGIDARIEELFCLESVSVGDFVLNGGEAAALCLIEAVSRLLPGFMGHEASGDEESFSAGLLEYPHFTRPEEFEGLAVPQALLCGDHAKITLWRRQLSLQRTLERRPDILAAASLTEADTAFLRTLPRRKHSAALYCALVHYPVLDRMKNSVAVSLTNLDIHDIARSSYTYGLGGFYIISPLTDQRELLDAILAHWVDGQGGQANPDRKKALETVRACPDIESAMGSIAAMHGSAPFVCGSSAKHAAAQEISFQGLADTLTNRPVLLLFGTGQGLAPEALALCDAVLPPIRPLSDYNHLSVRAAAAIVFDRIVGDWR